MANFINKYSDLAAYNADETKEYPNVSYLETEDMVKWQATEPIDQEHVVAKYNVTSTTEPTKILNNTSNITYMIVDGVEVSPSIDYTFSTTGAHTVKYKINSSWNGGNFNTCQSLTSITIPNSVTSIGEWTFRNCSGLTSVFIGSGVTTIGESAFSGCTSLTSVNIPSGVTSIGASAFNGCSSLTSVNIPSGVTSIGASAFNGCSSLASVNIPSGITIIESSVFLRCTSLTSVEIPDNVTSIKSSAFGQCTGLTNVTIGSGVSSIAGGGFYIGAFGYCSGLTSVTVEATTPPTMNSDAFHGTNNTFIIYVPAASVNAYKTAANWSSYASRIRPIQ